MKEYRDRYASGHTMTAIAVEFGVSRQAVSSYLRHNHPELVTEMATKRADSSAKRRSDARATMVLARFWRSASTHFTGSAYTKGCRCGHCAGAMSKRQAEYYVRKGRETHFKRKKQRSES